MSAKHNGSGIGREFEKAIDEGLNNNDWTGLNNVIMKSVDNFLDGVGDRMNSAMGQNMTGVPLSKRHEDTSGETATARAQRKLHAERAEQRKKMEEERRAREAARVQRRASRRVQTTALAFPFSDVGSARSTALSVVGGMGIGISAVAAILGGITGGGAIMPLAFFAASILVLVRGASLGSSAKLAKRYAEVIGKKEYIDIATLALHMNTSEKKVIRQLRKLLDQGYFPQGHLDRNCRTFILTDSVFEHYLELEEKGSSNIIDTTSRDEDEQEFPGLLPEESAELSRMIREGNGYITRFHELNADIPGIEISAKLDRLEGLLREIFARVKEHPEQMSRIHELMDYYLPTASKLVEAYRDYDRVSEPGKEILSAKQDIENTLDTINSALGKLLNKLFKDSVLDVTTDAEVLKTVLAQKGLAKGEMK